MFSKRRKVPLSRNRRFRRFIPLIEDREAPAFGELKIPKTSWPRFIPASTKSCNSTLVDLTWLLVPRCPSTPLLSIHSLCENTTDGRSGPGRRSRGSRGVSGTHACLDTHALFLTINGSGIISHSQAHILVVKMTSNPVRGELCLQPPFSSAKLMPFERMKDFDRVCPLNAHIQRNQ